MELVQAQVTRVIGSVQNEFAAVVKAEGKSFLIFIGQPEAIAIFRELKSLDVQRPLPHDVIINVFTAFAIEVRQVVISSIVSNIFCATLMLRQETPGDAPTQGTRNEVRLDLRASDAMIIALKTKAQLWVSREVLDVADDVTALIDQTEPDDDTDLSGGVEGEGG